MRNLTSRELMTELLISKYTLNRMVKQGLPHDKIRHGRKCESFFDAKEVRRWMRANGYARFLDSLTPMQLAAKVALDAGVSYATAERWITDLIDKGLPYVSITPHTNKRIPVREAYEWMKELKAQNR